MDINSSSAEETRNLAAQLASILRSGDILLLSGDLGAGKTMFAKGLGKGLGITDPITSPTFTLLQSYEGREVLHHIDAYRLDSPSDTLDLDLPTLMSDGGVIAIEWGEKLRQEIPQSYLEVSIEYPGIDGTPEDRLIRLKAVGDSWTTRLAQHSSLLVNGQC